MDRAQLRSWVPGLLLAAAIVACAQVGFVSVWKNGREADLQRELSELRREGLRTKARLAREARSAQLRAQRMRAGLARSRAQIATLRLELADARASEHVLRRRVETAADTLRNEPPPLGLRVAAIDPLSGLVATADNAGQQPIRIAESVGRLWIGEREEPLPPRQIDLAVEPGEELDFYDLPLNWASSLVANGELALRGALCVVYARDTDASGVEWARELWFEYRPGVSGVAVLQQERWAPWPGEVACNLSTAPRPW